ncbi:hypothetical protein LCGC14_2777660, partial [marine sediment metagenome]
MLPLLRILLIEQDPITLQELSTNLSKTIPNFERSDVHIDIIECLELKQALACVEADGDIQAVVLSWDVHNKGERTYSRFIEQLKGIRLELPVYVIGDDTKGLEIVNESEEIESFFFKDEVISDPEAILGYMINDFDDRSETPFWTAYRRYVGEANDSWHTPGHSGGSSFRNSPYIKDFYQFYGRNVFVGDLSVSVDSLGSLSDSTNTIGRAQESAAATFEVKHTYF